MYGKIFVQIYDGSLYGKWQALVTFQQLIVLADQDGTVDMMPQAIAARTSIPLEIIEQGIAELERPDPKSRTPDEEGRRIIRVSDSRDWGWTITNYAHYRAIRTAEERREYFREHKRKQRAATRVNQSPPVSTTGPLSPPIVEVEVEAKVKTPSRRKKPAEDIQPRETWLSPICAVWESKNGAGSFTGVAGQTAKALAPLKRAGRSPQEIAEHLERYIENTEPRFVSLAKFAATFDQWKPVPMVNEFGVPTLAGMKALGLA